jgi:hypothetical protein
LAAASSSITALLTAVGVLAEILVADVFKVEGKALMLKAHPADEAGRAP